MSATVQTTPFTQSKNSGKAAPISSVSNVTGKKRKSKADQNILHLSDGTTFNLVSDTVEGPTKVLVQALIARIKELTAPKKRAKKASSSSSSSSSSAAAPSKTILNGHKKQIIASVKANLKSVKFFTGYDAVDRKIKVDQFVPEAVFQALFGAEGTLMQPTPQNKPKSKVIIRVISGHSILRILGSPIFKGTEWIKGGAPQSSFGFGFFGGGGGRGGFSKGKKLKQVVLEFHQQSGSDIEVSYATTSQKLKFSLSFNTSNAVAHAAEYASRYDY